VGGRQALSKMVVDVDASVDVRVLMFNTHHVMC
jgi:hypothetical protein